MLPPKTIVLEYVCPLLGAIFANLMFAAPLKDVRDAVKNGSLGKLNPTPWAVMTGNCLGWIAYSFLIQNHFIFWANAPGLMMSVWLNMQAAKLQYCDRLTHDVRTSVVDFLQKSRQSIVQSTSQHHVSMMQSSRASGAYASLTTTNDDDEGQGSRREADDEEEGHKIGLQAFENMTRTAYDITIQRTEAPAPHERVVVGILGVWLALIAFVAFLPITLKDRELIVGIAVNVNIAFFYGAPLSTIFTVLKETDSSSIHRMTFYLNSLCALFFMLFGLGLWDYVLIVPNAIGVVLGVIQLLLIMTIPQRNQRESEQTDDDREGHVPSGEEKANVEK